MVVTAEERAHLDPYSHIAENRDVPLVQKISDLHAVVKAAGTGMLVTRDQNGNLHGRAMTPANKFDDSQISLIFLANNASAKCEEIENDSHVNVSFLNPSSTQWASFSGRARVTQDKDLIHKHWSSFITGYIGNLSDGVHQGDEEDPRVSVIEIIPEEIKYWTTKQSGISRTMQVAVGAAMGKATAPGELRTIKKEEIQLAQSLPTKGG